MAIATFRYKSNIFCVLVLSDACREGGCFTEVVPLAGMERLWLFVCSISMADSNLTLYSVYSCMFCQEKVIFLHMDSCYPSFRLPGSVVQAFYADCKSRNAFLLTAFLRWCFPENHNAAK